MTETHLQQSGRWFREGPTLVLHGLEPGTILDELAGEVHPAPAPVRVRHYHIRMVPDPTRPGLLVATIGASVMTPAAMRPGYVLPADSRRRALQAALATLLQTKYASAIAPAANLRVALCDMTGAKKSAPVFAGFWAFGPGAAFEGGSLVKILALYALYQLRFDLDICAARLHITKSAALLARINADWAKQGMRTPPNLDALFSFIESAGKTVRAQIKTVPDIHFNDVARVLIVNLGFEYIGSVALQSGLFDETQGGLWLNAAYNEPAITWTTSPFPKLERHNATALAAATFFALLAQGRLVTPAASFEIGAVLKKRVCMDAGAVEGIQGRGGVQGTPENKCGLLAPFFHEGFRVVRQPSSGRKVEYAAAVLSREPPTVNFRKLGKNLDKLIVAANP